MRPSRALSGLRGPRRAMGGVAGGGPRQGQECFEGGQGVGLVQGLLSPGLRVLGLDRDPGGVADEAVGIREGGPGGLDGLGVGVAVESFERPTQRAGLGPRVRRDRRGGRLAADVGHPVEARGCLAAADREVHGPVNRLMTTSVSGKGVPVRNSSRSAV